jgi:hypothetical protein
MLRPWLVTLVLGCLSCSKDNLAGDPFRRGAADAADASAPAGNVAGLDAGVPATMGGGDPTVVFGGPCVDDAECDDGIDCTHAVCDAATGRCRFTADDSLCDDGLFCNGIERCNPRLGCRPGPPTSCSDSTPCTIDSCDEATHSCIRSQRDVDGDGDVDGNCQPGHDCNDLDPTVSSLAPEICNNGVDDNCDGRIDEDDCQVPRFDTCADPLAIDAPGSYSLSGAGARLDYSASCAPNLATARDLVLSVSVPTGAPVDVDVVARSPGAQLALSRPSSCGSATEVECLPGGRLTSGESVGRLKLRALAPGVYPVYVFTDSGAPIDLEVSQAPAAVAPANTDCASALPLTPGTPVVADLTLGGTPLDSSCATGRGDLFYTFTLAAAADVRIVGDALDQLGLPRLSLRASSNCAARAAELSCDQGTSAALHHHALPAGTYLLAVSASGPAEVRVGLTVQAPTPAPDTDQCSTAPALTPNRTEDLSFIDHLDDIAAACSPGFIDAAYTLDLPSSSDVLLVGRFSSGDSGSVGLVQPACALGDVLGCSRPGSNPARASARALGPGRYRALVESAAGLPATLTAAVRPSVPVTLVPGADGCRDVLTIDSAGGLFQGSTLNAQGDFTASCDFATPNGSPDQLLRLVLDQPKRVLFDMRGSDFDTLLDLRRGPGCPGDEVLAGCSVGVGGEQSFLDLNLPAGEYFLQIDGYAGAQGSWSLDVHAMDP